MNSYSRFDPPVTFNEKISPVCLPKAGDQENLPFGTTCFATGTIQISLNKKVELINKT